MKAASEIVDGAVVEERFGPFGCPRNCVHNFVRRLMARVILLVSQTCQGWMMNVVNVRCTSRGVISVVDGLNEP